MFCLRNKKIIFLLFTQLKTCFSDQLFGDHLTYSRAFRYVDFGDLLFGRT